MAFEYDPTKRLGWHPVGERGKSYPPSLTLKARNRSGVYCIRHARTKEVLYVGESHTGNLLKTCTRHFQVWDDQDTKKAWHVTYAREEVEVAIVIVKKRCAVMRQNAMIRLLNPRDNHARPGDHVKLTAQDIEKIKTSKAPVVVLARLLGVHHSQVSRVRSGLQHRDVG